MNIDLIKEQLKQAYDKDSLRRSDKDYKRDNWKERFRSQFVELVKAEGRKEILELGAGAGIDSQFFSANGLNVLATDLSEGMVAACKALGLEAQQLDLYTLDNIEKTFEGVYAMNVLLHIPRSDWPKVLGSISHVLNEKGVFYLGVYGGICEEKTITDNTKMGMPRFFSFVADEQLLQLVKEFFEVIDFQTVDIGSKTPGFHYQSLMLRKK